MNTVVLLLSINARYSHAGHAIRSLRANLGPLRDNTELLEFDLRAGIPSILGDVRRRNPRILGISVYIWNVTRVVDLLRAIRREPEPVPFIVLGGPEASHAPEDHPLRTLADLVISGEAELLFPAACQDWLDGKAPSSRHLEAAPPDLSAVELADREYSDTDLQRRILYVESSRGCPFLCDYCLSALDPEVRLFPLERLFASWNRLLERGARQFKFLDRTFNLDDDRAASIMRFFSDRRLPDLRLHFEWFPGPLSDTMKDALLRFPPGALHLEVGIQTYQPDVARRIHRPGNADQANRHIRFLVEDAGALVHADLIAGLPGESLEQFAAGFDRLFALHPAEIQVGVLKLLHGAPMARHTREWGMSYNPEPPYEALSTSAISADDLLRVKRFAHYWERLHNRGFFPRTLPLILAVLEASPFAAFMRLADALHDRLGTTGGVPLFDLIRAVQEYLVCQDISSPQRIAKALLDDYLSAPGRIKPPRFLTAAAEGHQGT